MPATPPNRQRNLAEADQAARQHFANEELSSPVQPCPARHPQIFVVPSRYAMAQEPATHEALKPAAPTQSHPMALRRLRPGYLYLWHIAGPLKRYAVAADGGLLEQQAEQPHATFETGEQVGIALNKSADAWMLYSEMPLGKQARERLEQSVAERTLRMQRISLTEVALRLSARHCPPLELAAQLVAELMPDARQQALAHDYQQHAATYREGLDTQAKAMQESPTADNVKTYAASAQWLHEREQAAHQYSLQEPAVAPGLWSACPWDLPRTEAWIDRAKSAAGALYGVMAALDDDLGVLRDIDHEQNQVEAAHEEWLADNSLRQAIGSFIRGLSNEDPGEVAELLNYRYRQHNLELTREQGQILLDSQHQLKVLFKEETRINQQRGRAYGHAQADALLLKVRAQEESVLNKVRGFIPPQLHHEAQQVVRDYSSEKLSHAQGGRGNAELAKYIDLESMNHWLEQQAPAHFRQVEERHQALYADRQHYLPRSANGTWFVEHGSEEHQEWLERLAVACLSAQCNRSQGAQQFSDYVRSDNPGLLRLVFQAWSPSLEAAVNNAARLNELSTALSQENLADSRAAMAKTLDADTLRTLERLAANLEGSWTAVMTRLSAALIHDSQNLARAMGLLLVVRLGENSHMLRTVENGLSLWRLAGQKAEALGQWTHFTAKAIGLGKIAGITGSSTVSASGGLLPLAALVLNVLNASSYARQNSVLEGGDGQRQAESLSAYLYAGAALGAVIQHWMVLKNGKEITGRLPFGRSVTAPTLTLFGGIIGILSFGAAVSEFKSLQIQLESSRGNIDPWLSVKRIAVTGQVAAYGAQGLLGLGLTGMRLANLITTPVAIRRFRLGMGPINLLLLGLGGLYLFAWFRQASPLQHYLANCCWSHRRAATNQSIDPQTQLNELNLLFTLLYQPRLGMETRQVRISGALGDTITQDGISRLTIDLPGAAPESTEVDLAMSGNPTPYTAHFNTGTQGTSIDLGADWLRASKCQWIPADEGQGLRLTASFPRSLTRLSLRIRYHNPMALLAGGGATIGGPKGMAYVLAPNGGLLSPDGEIITLRPGEPTPELDRAAIYRLGAGQPLNYLDPKERA